MKTDCRFFFYLLLTYCSISPPHLLAFYFVNLFFFLWNRSVPVFFWPELSSLKWLLAPDGILNMAQNVTTCCENNNLVNSSQPLISWRLLVGCKLGLYFFSAQPTARRLLRTRKGTSNQWVWQCSVNESVPFLNI